MALWGGCFYYSHILCKRWSSLKMVKKLPPKDKNVHSVATRSKVQVRWNAEPILWANPLYLVDAERAQLNSILVSTPCPAQWHNQQGAVSFLHGFFQEGQCDELVPTKWKWRVTCPGPVGWEAGMPLPCCLSSLSPSKALHGKCGATPWPSHWADMWARNKLLGVC